MRGFLPLFASLFFCVSASANWVSEVNYTDFSDDEGGSDISLGAVGVSIGHQYEINESFNLTPQIRAGFGVKDDGPIELDNFIGLGLRGEYYTSESFYLMANVALLKVTSSGTAFSTTVSDSSSELGYGAGAGFMVSDDISIELGYEKFDSTDVLRAGVRFRF